MNTNKFWKHLILIIVFALTAAYGVNAVAGEVILEIDKDIHDYYYSWGTVTDYSDRVYLSNTQNGTDAGVKYLFYVTEWQPWITKIEVGVQYKTYDDSGGTPKLYAWDYINENGHFVHWGDLPKVDSPTWKWSESANHKYIEPHNNEHIVTVEIAVPDYDLDNEPSWSRTYIYDIRLKVHLNFDWGHGTLDNTLLVDDGPKVVDFGEVDLGISHTQNITIQNLGLGLKTLNWETSGISWILPDSGSISPKGTDTISVKLDGSKVDANNVGELNGKLLSLNGAGHGLSGYLYYIPDSDLTTDDDILTDLDKVLAFLEERPDARFSFYHTWDKIKFHWGSNILDGWLEDDWFKPSDNAESAILKRRFAGIFTGFINIDTTGEYTFFVTSDDGFRLKINNQVVTEHPNSRGTATSEGTISLNEGLYPIELTYFESTGKKCLTLEWDPAGSVSRELVPQNKLYNGRYLLVRATPKKPTVVFTNEKGSNNKVNVPVGASAQFTVNATRGSTGVDIERYRWQKKTGSDAPGAGYNETTDDNYNFTFDNPGEYTVYCQVVDEKGVESDGWVGISVRAWNRPVVHDTPPQERIDAGDVSWFDGKYVGVAGQSVRLMGDGETGTTGEGEEIAKYLWYLNSEWVEQAPDEVLSHTWNNPSTNDQVKCKAETNYGIQSAEKSFSLRIYNNLEVDSGGDYTGKPNTAIALNGSINTDSYPGASFEYQWRVDSATPDGEVRGDATHEGDYIEFTTPEPSSQNGQFEYTDLPLSDDWSVIGEFKIWGGIGNGGADAFYIYVWASETPQNENWPSGQYSINFDEYQDEIQLKYDGNILEVVSQNGIDNGK